MKPTLDPRDRESIQSDLESGDDEVRRLAVDRLLLLPPDEALPTLVDRLGDPSWRVRKAAIDGLVAAPESWPVADPLIASLADGENPGRRNAAVEALVRCGERAIDGLLETTRSGDVDVRKLVVDALAGIGSERSAPRLVELLVDPDPNVRAAVADALGAIGGDQATRALLETALRDAEDPLVRLSALRGIARLEVAVEAAELGSALADPILRPAAFAVLGRTDDPEAEEALLKGLQAHSRSAREAAMEALLRVVGRADPDGVEDRVERIRAAVRDASLLVDDAVERLEDAELPVRLMLVQFLGLLGMREVALPLLRAARDEALCEVALAALITFGVLAEEAVAEAWDELDASLRGLACAVLSRTGGARGLDVLIDALEDADPATRTAAADALGRRADPASAARLVQRLHRAATDPDPEPEVEEEHGAITHALIRIARAADTDENRADVVDVLADSVEGAPEAVRFAIACVLAEVGDTRHASTLALLLQDPSPAVRRCAVAALARVEAGAACEPLRLALADEAAEVRAAVATTLGTSPQPDAADDLQLLVADEDPSVRAAAVRALGAWLEDADEDCFGGPLAHVEHALGDVSAVALAAIDAYEILGEHTSLRPLHALLAHPDPEVVQAAVRCLSVRGRAEDHAALLSLVSHPHWAVRADSIEALASRRVVSAVPAILRRLETEQDEFVRDVILRALSRLEG